MAAKLAFVKKVLDPKKFVILFSIPEYIDGRKAFPIDVYDEPRIGDPIWVYSIDTKFNLSWVYCKQRLMDYTRLKLGNSMVSIRSNSVDIETSNGNTVNIDSNGNISIHSNSTIDIHSDNNVYIDAKSTIITGDKFDVSQVNNIVFPKRFAKPGQGPGPFATTASGKPFSNEI